MSSRKYKTYTRKMEISGLENQLQSVLRPLNPRPEFIGDLRTRLKSYSELPDDQLPSGMQFLLILAFSLVTVLAMVAVSIRVVMVMLGALGMLSQLRRRQAGTIR